MGRDGVVYPRVVETGSEKVVRARNDAGVRASETSTKRQIRPEGSYLRLGKSYVRTDAWRQSRVDVPVEP